MLDLEEFCGWDPLIKLCECGKNDRDQGLPAIMFQTGSRVSEVLMLNSKHFSIEGDFVVCSNVPLVKQKKISPFRSFSFPLDEPLWKYSSKWIEQRKKKELLFPHDRTWAYRKVVGFGKQIGVKVWDHWFRSMRASQLAAEYGVKGADLREWFKVRDLSWDSRYGKLGVSGLQALIQKNRGKV